MYSKQDLADAEEVYRAMDYDDVDDFSGRVINIYTDSAKVIARIKATARAEALREAAERAVKYFGWGLGSCTYAADDLRAAILADKQEEK